MDGSDCKSTRMIRLIFTSFLLFIIFDICAQTDSSIVVHNLQIDTVSHDSVPLYKNLKKFASNRKLTSWIYDLLFKDPNFINVPADEQCYDEFCIFQGKYIRNIRIIVLDPFGTDRQDTLKRANNFLEKAGNSLHIKTQHVTIRNLLLFKKGEALDSLKIMESERILRQNSGIRDALISINKSNKKGDSVDVLVIVRDLFTITGGLGLSPTEQSFDLKESNFLGLSHILSTRFIFRQNHPQKVYGFGSYTVSNIGNSLVTGVLYYSASSFHQMLGVSFDRSFISPLISWGGGVAYGYMRTNWPFDSSGMVPVYPLNYHFYDNWIGKSISIGHGVNRQYNDSKLIIAARFFRLKYVDRPSFDIDYTLDNQSSYLYLASVGLSIRGYYKDINIYRFDRIEDVPEGRLFSITLGYENKEFVNRPYFGLKIAAGQHIPKLGYIAYKFEYGSFLNHGIQEQGAFQVEINYLTDLLNLRKWKVREFISYRLTSGINRQPDEFLDISTNNSLTGFDSKTLIGTNRAILKFMTVIYLPYKFIGFQFAPTIFAKFGTIGNSPSSTITGHIYQSYGLGVLLRNEYLAFNTIEVSFNYFPYIPNKEGSRQKFVPVSLSAIKFIDYYESKPYIIPFI